MMWQHAVQRSLHALKLEFENEQSRGFRKTAQQAPYCKCQTRGENEEQRFMICCDSVQPGCFEWFVLLFAAWLAIMLCVCAGITGNV